MVQVGDCSDVHDCRGQKNAAEIAAVFNTYLPPNSSVISLVTESNNMPLTTLLSLSQVTHCLLGCSSAPIVQDFLTFYCVYVCHSWHVRAVPGFAWACGRPTCATKDPEIVVYIHSDSSISACFVLSPCKVSAKHAQVGASGWREHSNRHFSLARS